MFCSPNTAVTSEGTSPYCAIRSGFSQIRMLYVSPQLHYITHTFDTLNLRNHVDIEVIG